VVTGIKIIIIPLALIERGEHCKACRQVSDFPTACSSLEHKEPKRERTRVWFGELGCKAERAKSERVDRLLMNYCTW